MKTEELPATIHLGAFPVDPGFPQLEVASDPKRMLAIFRQALKPAPGKACQILDCVPFRFRCGQSETRCVLQYSLRLGDPESGRQWDQWVTGLIYAEPGEAERLWRQLSAGDPMREIPEGWRNLEPVGFIPELDMVVEVFPFDRRLPQLGRVIERAARDVGGPLVERLGLGPGPWHLAEPRIEPRRYRTELGAVLSLEVTASEARTGRIERPRCYLKVYRNGRGRETFEWLRSWWQGAPGRPYSMVRPLDYLDDVRTLVLEEAPGESLRQILLRGEDPQAAARAVARAVAAFHRDDLGVTRSHTLAETRDGLRRASALVRWACPEKRAKIGGVAAVVLQALEEVPPAPIHRDLTPEHVFLSGDRVTFVDSDSVALGDPVRDPALLVAHLVGRVGIETIAPEPARAIAAAFVEEYFAQVPEAWRKRFRLLCAGAFIEVAAGIFRSQEPGWRDRVTEVASNAAKALAGEFG